MTADYMGTNIRSAMAFACGARNPLLPTTVLVLTDGEVGHKIFCPIKMFL